ncbi:hypothetical protein [Streptomyces lydicus]|uniref:hypothetical protein n=1 Tax=Streptomyces lydicus TaxID=47763 RepID=UPI0036B7AC8E
MPARRAFFAGTRTISPAQRVLTCPNKGFCKTLQAASLIGMLSQVIPLIGVLLGAATSFFATSLAERTKFRQTMATRWDERKLDTYIEYVSCVKEAIRAARQTVEARELGADGSESLSVMEAAEARRSILFEGLVLLGDDAASQAAMVVNERLWAVLRRVRDPAGGSTTGRDLGSSVVEALNVLHKAARSDLAIGKSYGGGTAR